MGPIGDSVATSNPSNVVTGTTTKIAAVALTASGKPKEKRRNNEKRKERSRDAARFRRSRETEIFNELSQFLPLKKEHVNQLDKTSMMRIAIAYLKVRGMLKLFPKILACSGDFKIHDNDNVTSNIKSSTISKLSFDFFNFTESNELMKQTLDGFLIIISNDGDIMYVSSNITEYLGIAKIDIVGQHIWEYSHQCDHAELKDALNIRRTEINDSINGENLDEEGLHTVHRELLVRLKCTLTSRGRSINIKSASYKVIHITGHLVIGTNGDRVLVAIGRPIPHPSNIEIPLETTTFLTKHRTNMQFIYVDDKMRSLLGYNPEDLIDKSFFDCHHGADSDSLMAAFKTVFSKGQGETCRYRFLGKSGGFCWVFTQATILYDKLKPQSVVCVNYIISNLENKDEIYSLAQYEANLDKLNKNNRNSNGESVCNESNPIECSKKPQQEIKQVVEESTPTSATNTNKNNIINDTINQNDGDDGIVFGAKFNILPLCEKLIIKEARTSPKLNILAETSSSSEASQQFIGTNVKSLNAFDASRQTPLCISLQNNCSLKWTETEPTVLLPRTTASPKSAKHPKSVTASVFRSAPPIKKTTNCSAKNCIVSNPTATVQLLPSSTEILSPIANTSGQPIFLNTSQLPPENSVPRAQSVTASVFTPISSLPNKQQQKVARVTIFNGQQQQQHQQKFSSLERIEDMNKGFLSFAEDTQLRMLKEEPDDLAQLGSTTVGACMPLDETTPLFGEMLVGLMPYDSLLPDDINSLESATSSTSPPVPLIRTHILPTGSCNSKDNNHIHNIPPSVSSTSSLKSSSSNCAPSEIVLASSTCKEGLIDPFINYREESNDTICSQHLLSPNMVSKSPEVSSLPSLCSPNSLSQEDEFAFMTMNVDDDIDLSMRAPYIPMNEQDDLPLLTADDLMWCGGSTFSTDELNMPKEHVFQYNVLKQQMQTQQNLEQLEQQGFCTNRNLINYHQLQLQQQQQQQVNNFHDSLCSSPTSSTSSLSASALKTHRQQQQNRNSNQQEEHQQNSADSVFSTDSSELAALLCGNVNGPLSILSSNCGDVDGGESVTGCSRDSNSCIDDKNTISPTQQQQAINNTSDLRPLSLQIELQGPQHQMLDLGIDCKKQNFEKNSIGDNFENVYNNKDSTNLDCWNELLQINADVTSSSTATLSITPKQISAPQQEQQEEVQIDDLRQHESKPHIPLKQPNISANPATKTTTQHMPFITLHNRNILLQRLPDQKVTLSDALMSDSHFGNNKKITTIKLLNATISTPNSAISTAGIRTTDNKLSKATAIASIKQQHSNKRHLTSLSETTQVDTKRLKNSDSTATIELQTSPQPLQQVMSPIQALVAPADIKVQERKVTPITAQGWSNMSDMKAITMTTNQTSQEKQQQSNSVLKNLLINGCDGTFNSNANSICQTTANEEPLLAEDCRQTQALPQICVASSPTKTLSVAVITSTSPVAHHRGSPLTPLRNYRHNPMIGGPGVLPSPPELTSCDTDSARDNCFEGISTIENVTVSPPKSLIVTKLSNFSSNAYNKVTNPELKGLLMPTMNNTDVLLGNHVDTPPPLPPSSQTVCIKQKNKSVQERKECDDSHKIYTSFMDTRYPLLTPLIMDFCSDDYSMNIDEFLGTNDIDQVLREWKKELV